VPPVPSRSYRLTKSRYIKGLICRKALWLLEHDPGRAGLRPPARERILNQGTEVGLLATERFPGGVFVQAAPQERERALAETRRALASEAPAVFEAAFLYHETFVRVDVLRRAAGGAWDLIEVKSTTRVKEEHLPDAAVQRFVAEGGGLRVAGVFLMHLNPACTFPDLSDLFILEDLEARVAAILERVGGELDGFLRLLEQRAEPRVPVGPQCTTPYECEFKAYCWRRVPEVSVFNVPLLKSESKAELAARGILDIARIPPDFPLPRTASWTCTWAGGRRWTGQPSAGSWEGWSFLCTSWTSKRTAPRCRASRACTPMGGCPSSSAATG